MNTVHKTDHSDHLQFRWSRRGRKSMAVVTAWALHARVGRIRYYVGRVYEAHGRYQLELALPVGFSPSRLTRDAHGTLGEAQDQLIAWFRNLSPDFFDAWDATATKPQRRLLTRAREGLNISC